MFLNGASARMGDVDEDYNRTTKIYATNTQ